MISSFISPVQIFFWYNFIKFVLPLSLETFFVLTEGLSYTGAKKQPVAQEYPFRFTSLFLLVILFGDWSWVDQLIGSLSMASALQKKTTVF